MGNWKSALHVTPGAPPTRMLKNFSIPKYTDFFACGALVVIISIPFNIDKKSVYPQIIYRNVSTLQKFEYTLGIFSIPSKLWREFQYTLESSIEISVYPRIFSLPRNIWWTFQYTLDQKDFSKVKCTLRSLIRLFSILTTQASLTEISVYPINSSIRIFCRDLWQNFSIIILRSLISNFITPSEISVHIEIINRNFSIPSNLWRKFYRGIPDRRF